MPFSQDSENRLAIITVAYYSNEPLVSLAEHLVKESLQEFCWLIVNNSPYSSEPIKINSNLNFSIIRGDEGGGFGAGCNLGLDELNEQGWKGWVWLLNPDSIFLKAGTIKSVLNSIKHLPNTSILGTSVFNENGLLEESAGWIDPGLCFRSRKVNTALGRSKPIKVDWISGCSMLFNPSAHSSPLRFEEKLPLYYEDIDLCIRSARNKTQILWVPSLEIVHIKGRGSRTSHQRRIRLSTCSYIRFLQRHRPGVVLFLRVLRLIGKAFLTILLTPKRSFAVFQGWCDAIRNPLR